MNIQLMFLGLILTAVTASASETTPKTTRRKPTLTLPRHASCPKTFTGYQPSILAHNQLKIFYVQKGTPGYKDTEDRRLVYQMVYLFCKGKLTADEALAMAPQDITNEEIQRLLIWLYEKNHITFNEYTNAVAHIYPEMILPLIFNKTLSLEEAFTILIKHNQEEWAHTAIRSLYTYSYITFDEQQEAIRVLNQLLQPEPQREEQATPAASDDENDDSDDDSDDDCIYAPRSDNTPAVLYLPVK